MCDVSASDRALAAVLFCLLLSGCFGSEQPKFPLATAVSEFGDGGRDGFYQRDASGDFQRQETYEIRHRDDGTYEFIGNSDQVDRASVHATANGMLVMQLKSERNKPPYMYAVMQVTGGDALIYVPDCDKQDQDTLASFGVEKRNSDECGIDRVADPAGLLAAVNLGDLTMKFVRDVP
jgi:hypothetical protein